MPHYCTVRGKPRHDRIEGAAGAARVSGYHPAAVGQGFQHPHAVVACTAETTLPERGPVGGCFNKNDVVGSARRGCVAGQQEVSIGQQSRLYSPVVVGIAPGSLEGRLDTGIPHRDVHKLCSLAQAVPRFQPDDIHAGLVKGITVERSPLRNAVDKPLVLRRMLAGIGNRYRLPRRRMGGADLKTGHYRANDLNDGRSRVWQTQIRI